MQWFKLYGSEMLADPKYQRLTASERSCWITLLCLASLNEGVVHHCEESYLIPHSGVEANDYSKVHGILVKLEMLGMITQGRDAVTGVTFIGIKNWQKRQEVYSESYERVKRFRAKNKDLSPSVTNVALQSNVRREENRREENRNKGEGLIKISKFKPESFK